MTRLAGERHATRTGVYAYGLWPRRRGLGWTAGLAGMLGAAELAVRQEAGGSLSRPDAGSPDPSPSATLAVVVRPYAARAQRVLFAAHEAAFERRLPAYDQEDVLLGIAVAASPAEHRLSTTAPEVAALEAAQ